MNQTVTDADGSGQTAAPDAAAACRGCSQRLFNLYDALDARPRLAVLAGVVSLLLIPELFPPFTLGVWGVLLLAFAMNRRGHLDRLVIWFLATAVVQGTCWCVPAIRAVVRDNELLGPLACAAALALPGALAGTTLFRDPYVDSIATTVLISVHNLLAFLPYHISCASSLLEHLVPRPMGLALEQDLVLAPTLILGALLGRRMVRWVTGRRDLFDDEPRGMFIALALSVAILTMAAEVGVMRNSL